MQTEVKTVSEIYLILPGRLIRILNHAYYHIKGILDLYTDIIGIDTLVFKFDTLTFLICGSHLDRQSA